MNATTGQDSSGEAAKLIAQIVKLARESQIYQYKPYPWQEEFHNAGRDNPERLLMAANGVGKTLCGGFETAVHLTGDYPDWWEGRRFEEPVTWWVGSITNQTQRDYTQPILLGSDLGENLGTGFIPKDRIDGKPKTRQAGIADVCDLVRVRHRNGGLSTAVFKTYEQGWRAWQGAAPNGIWGDEQPDESAANEKRIFSEAQTRVFRSSGIMLWTLTPLLGETEFIRHFLYPKTNGIYWKGATWDDAPHLKEEDKQRLLATYPSHELDVRTKGLPMMGEGRVFKTSEDEFTIDPIRIEPWFARIKGVDFGIDHPAAVADIAWDRDRDIIYVTRTWREKDADSEEHAQAINHKTPWIPVAWPHDGTNREKGSGDRLKDIYVKHQVRMLSKSARYRNDTGGSQRVEPIVLEVQERLANGGFKVFSTCKEFFEEYRSYHRKEGKIVPIRDDVLKAVFYAVMMRRYAQTQAAPVRSDAPMQAVFHT